MVTKKNVGTNYLAPKPKRKNKGVHSKTKTSKIKTSKLYKKPSRGQG